MESARGPARGPGGEQSPSWTQNPTAAQNPTGQESSDAIRARPPTARPPSARPPSARPPSARPPSARPPSARPPSMRAPSGRPPTARPPSAGRGSPLFGTASRLTSAIRTGTAMARPPTSGMSIVDRPITQQGLSGLRSAATARGTGPAPRQVQDKRYFQGLLQMKCREIVGATQRLHQEMEALRLEQSTYLTYDARAKQMAQELTDLQGQLADLNLVVDKLNTDTDRNVVEAETRELRATNERRAVDLEQAFEERRNAEARVRQMEQEIEQERQLADSLISGMEPTLRQRYQQLLTTNQQLQNGMQQLQSQLDMLGSRKSGLEGQLKLSHVKQEAVRLHARLAEAQERHAQLLAEEKARASPAQEREALLQRVRDDNTETTNMERQLAQMRESLRQKQTQLEMVEQDLEESQSERHQKYRELRRREETMETFLSTYEENREAETKRIQELEGNIVTSLTALSRVASRSEKSIDAEALLALNEDEIQNSGTLSAQYTQLKLNMSKVTELETKIRAEKSTLEERMSTMENELPRLKDLSVLRTKSEQKRLALIEEQSKLDRTSKASSAALREGQNRHDALKKQLANNETYAQLSNLERKLSLLGQNNFAMKDYIDSRKSAMKCEQLKKQAYESVCQYNNSVKESLKAGHVLVM